ncbi:hypothetical protein B0O99DRAFT_677108 [Bisporella sp. PMI_857]|nr:hypothetical protein B0O99DRAFT_677108 [Bisporella sp. PMI_857]
MSDHAVHTAAPLSEVSPAAGQQKYPQKRLIVCCDGTWNAGDIDAKILTNVARITRCISDVDNWKYRKDGKSERNYISQIVHYQPGIGLGTDSIINIYDAMTGRGLSKAIREAYSFICLNWSSKADEIVLIGFSRGAFTVRCVAEFMDKVGLLTKSGLRHLPSLFKMWKHLKNGEDSKESEDLEKRCKTFLEWGELRRGEKEVQIEACAVWDTVSAVAFPMPAHVPQTSRRRYRTVGESIPKNIKLAIQALALDETRRHFKPMVWDERKKLEHQKLIQCWFAGNHADVGGGNKDMTLANISLAWMIGQLTDKIHFDQNNLWAITTTRSWSKPSPSDELADTSPDPRMRNCKVVATAPISPDLLRSKDSWSQFFQKKLGGSRVRSPEQGSIHYSVCIFDHLGIAEYKTYFPESADTESFLLSYVVPRLSENNKFEGDILERWTKHVLCAHVNVRQSRNSEEKNILERPSLLDARLRENLLPNASYEASIPIFAILSAFHRLAKQYQGCVSKPLKDFCKQGKVQDQSRWKQIRASRRGIKPTFKFEVVKPEWPSSGVSPPVLDQELVVDENQQQPTLVFTRVFPLLMGLPHELPRQGEPRRTSTFRRVTKSDPVGQVQAGFSVISWDTVPVAKEVLVVLIHKT